MNGDTRDGLNVRQAGARFDWMSFPPALSSETWQLDERAGPVYAQALLAANRSYAERVGCSEGKVDSCVRPRSYTAAALGFLVPYLDLLVTRFPTPPKSIAPLTR